MEENLPEFLRQALLNQYGEKWTKEIIKGYQCKRYTSFRVNLLKSNIDEIENFLVQKKIVYEKPKLMEEAFILREIKEDEIRKWDIYQQGKIYLQSLSSMLPPLFLEPKQGIDILDMAAAPGRENDTNCYYYKK